MKIAVISDIHANYFALEVVMEDMKFFGPDKIFCLGDLIMAGINPNRTMDMIFKLKNKFKDNFEIIQGNTDRMIANCNEKMIKDTIEQFPCMGYSLENDVKITKKEYIDFVRELPEKKRVVVNGLKIDLVHGSPRSQVENIYPDLKQSVVNKIGESTDADLILCGHTHIPCGYSLLSGQTIVNVGSVGRSMTQNKMPVYLQITISDSGDFMTEHRVVKYNNYDAYKAIMKRKLESIDELADMYLE